MRFNDLPGWEFKVEETSAGVYRVVGVDSSGRNVERSGLDPEVLFEEVKQDAANISNK